MKRYIRATSSNKKLYVCEGNRVEEYEYKCEDGQGSVYEPADSNNWWTSYIVTPNNQLLTWTLKGNYIPSAREFWVE